MAQALVEMELSRRPDLENLQSLPPLTFDGVSVLLFPRIDSIGRGCRPVLMLSKEGEITAGAAPLSYNRGTPRQRTAIKRSQRCARGTAGLRRCTGRCRSVGISNHRLCGPGQSRSGRTGVSQAGRFACRDCSTDALSCRRGGLRPFGHSASRQSVATVRGDCGGVLSAGGG